MSYVRNVFAATDCQRRLAKIHAKRQVIDPERLEKLASDPALKSGSIARLFGYGRAAFFVYLSQHEELWRVYEDARVRAGCKTGNAYLRARRDPLDEDDSKIIDAIAHGARTVGEIETALKVDPHVFATRLYNLENEKHEIWSQAIGRPPVTNYFLRGEEAQEMAKGRAA